MIRGPDIGDSEWTEVEKAERKIRLEISRSCSCHAEGPESCIPCEWVPELLNILDTTVIYGAILPGKCGKAGLLGRYIYLTPTAFDPAKCSCVAATLYHEALHNMGWGHVGRNNTDPVDEFESRCKVNLCH